MVADLGIQTRGWTVEQAQRYVRLQLPNLPEERITSVVSLLASIPGYVASYTVGAAEIGRIRAEAERALGRRFDIRAFHQAVLEDGTIPLPMLAEKIDRWVKDRR